MPGGSWIRNRICPNHYFYLLTPNVISVAFSFYMFAHQYYLADSNFNSSKIGPTSPTEFEVQDEHHGSSDGGDAVADEALSWSSARLYKNLLLLSISFFFVFSAFQALSNLQSSINCDAGLGLASLAAIYATIIVSGMYIAPIAYRK